MTPRGAELLRDHARNKSTAFTDAERQREGIEGLLPASVETLETQVQRCVLQLDRKPSDIERYIYLSRLSEDNQTLFFAVLASDPARFIPIVYDPTVGTACAEFGHIFRAPAGVYLTLEHRGRVKEVLGNWPVRDVRFICVSTGGRILGLGDLGSNGMGIPIGKLQLYTACAGVPPGGLLPLLLDCGADNEKLLADPLYLGLRQKRPPVEELDAFVEEFVQAVQELYPRCCIHFEDWKGTDALRLLKKYVTKVCCYNDDIQGTGSVVVAGLYNALKIIGQKLTEQRVLFFGAGSAAIGIANMIVSAMELEGLSKEDGRGRVSLFDVDGLIEQSRKNVSEDQKAYAHQHEPAKDLLTAIRTIKPTILIGVSTVGKSFTQEVIEEMAKNNDRPVIFALSNPTEHSECTAEEAYRYSHGKAVFAGGVQFDKVTLDGKTYLPAQANNFYIFPAVSLAVYATEAKRVPDELFIEAARATADQVSNEDLQAGMLFPPQKNILNVEVRTAAAVAKKAFDLGLARVKRPDNIERWMNGLLYRPSYES